VGHEGGIAHRPRWQRHQVRLAGRPLTPRLGLMRKRLFLTAPPVATATIAASQR
jgi:hypothetical protein